MAVKKEQPFMHQSHRRKYIATLSMLRKRLNVLPLRCGTGIEKPAFSALINIKIRDIIGECKTLSVRIHRVLVRQWGFKRWKAQRSPFMLPVTAGSR